MNKAKLISDNISVMDVFADLQKDARGFALLSDKLKKLTGIHLAANSKNFCLMASRLGPLMRTFEIETYSDYLDHLKTAGAAAQQEFISALTTNTTQFFRENKHFDILKEELPRILDRKARLYQRELRFWCAAASTGQEVFTIAMIAAEATRLDISWEIKILATDIDTEVLEKACHGLYTEAEISSIPALYKQKYLKASSRAGFWQFRPEILKLIRFAPFNLLTPQYPFQHPFDVVFCRNVLIYFEHETSQDVVSRLAKTLAPEGLLFLGHSESSAMKSPLLSSIAPAAYIKRPSRGSRT